VRRRRNAPLRHTSPVFGAVQMILKLCACRLSLKLVRPVSVNDSLVEGGRRCQERSDGDLAASEPVFGTVSDRPGPYSNAEVGRRDPETGGHLRRDTSALLAQGLGQPDQDHLARSALSSGSARLLLRREVRRRAARAVCRPGTEPVSLAGRAGSLRTVGRESALVQQLVQAVPGAGRTHRHRWSPPPGPARPPAVAGPRPGRRIS